MINYEQQRLKAVISHIRMLEQMYKNHEPSADEIIYRAWFDNCLCLLNALSAREVLIASLKTIISAHDRSDIDEQDAFNKMCALLENES